ncbi:hypothetical protein BJ508DRAFT_310758 [Ascobolus immersus RN42]|uniref:Uncharacterized protein n=1 Tax=Ascobolus immersus RN42 TaxID=1160509 RepID=A0A3N4HUS1_ASCIM|nr:hypothetical protein BJ508DRAFT_310758 [Ascobolus immersus RN42]
MIHLQMLKDDAHMYAPRDTYSLQIWLKHEVYIVSQTKRPRRSQKNHDHETQPKNSIPKRFLQQQHEHQHQSRIRQTEVGKNTRLRTEVKVKSKSKANSKPGHETMKTTAFADTCVYDRRPGWTRNPRHLKPCYCKLEESESTIILPAAGDN